MDQKQKKLSLNHPTKIKNQINSSYYISTFDNTKYNFYQYEIILPVHCNQFENIYKNDQNTKFIQFCKYKSELYDNFTISIYISHINREVGASEWVELDLVTNKNEILDRREIYCESGFLSEFLTKILINKQPFITRISMIKDGQRIFRIDAQVPEDMYDEVSEQIFISLSSFRLLKPEGQFTAEKLEKYERIEPINIFFNYPSSWQIKKNMYTNNFYDIIVDTSFNNVCAGQIYIEIHNRHEAIISKVLSAYFDRLKKVGVLTTGSPLIPVHPPKQFESAQFYYSSAKYNNYNINTPVLLFEVKKYIVLLGLIGPSKEAAPEWWAINKRAFEIVRDSLCVGKDDNNLNDNN